MKLTRQELAAATASVRELLERLRLQQYQFAVEPRPDGCDVRIEYAASDGWRTAVLHVEERALASTRKEHGARQRLLGEWRRRLQHAVLTPEPHHPPERSAMERALVAEAIALGRAWAHGKADELRDRVPATDWPDFWDSADDGELPEGLDARELEQLRTEATRAARERWRELLTEQRSAESVDEAERELDASTAHLEAQLRSQL